MKDRERRWLRQRSCLILSCVFLGLFIIIFQRNTRHSFQLPALSVTTTVGNLSSTTTTNPELTLIVPSTFEDYQCYSTRFFDILYNDIIDLPDQIIFVVSQVPTHASPRLNFPPPAKVKNKNSNDIDIQILSFQSKHSAAQNRNIGAYVATGNVLTFFDIDDVPHPLRFHIIRKLFKDNPQVDAALFTYVNGTHTDGLHHKFKTIDTQNLPRHYDILKLKKAYRQWWRENPEVHPDYFELWCCRPVGKYMHNGWGTYRRNVFLDFKYKEGLFRGEDSDLNARMIFDTSTGFTFWDLELGFYTMIETTDSDGDPELQGKSALVDERKNMVKKNLCPWVDSNNKKASSGTNGKAGKMVCPTSTTTTTTASSVCSQSDKFKGGKISNPQDANHLCRPLLFTGCGYSGTTFLGKLFSSAGYDVPHECLGNDGTSDWRYSFESARPLPFQHIFMQVRHPLAVVASWHSVQWNFTVDKTWQECRYENWQQQELDVRDYFKAGDLNYLSREVQALEWWAQAVSRIFPAVECWWKLEDFSPELAVEICIRAGFVGCSVPDWERLIQQHENVNSHREEDVDAPKPTWESLCGKKQVLKDDRRSKRERVCEKARALCREFKFENC